MGLLGFLFRNKNEGIPYEETEKGKAFAEKMREEAEERARKKAEWENTVPPERKEQVKLFKIFFTIFFLGFVILLLYGFRTKMALIFLCCEFLFAGLSLILFFIKPKFIKYPNCFMMPVLAFFCSAIMFVFFGFQYGFVASFDKNTFAKNKTETVSEDEKIIFPDFVASDFKEWKSTFNDDFFADDVPESLENTDEDFAPEELEVYNFEYDNFEYRSENGR